MDDHPISSYVRGVMRVEQRPAGPVDLGRLRQLVTDHFNDTEIRNLCFDLGISYDDLSGSVKADKARELLAYVARRKWHYKLLAKCREHRPEVDWSVVSRPVDPKTSSQFSPIVIIVAILILVILFIYARPSIGQEGQKQPAFNATDTPIATSAIPTSTLPTATMSSPPFVPRNYDFRDVVAYTDPGSIYQISIPAEWAEQNRLLAASATSIVQAQFGPKTFPDIYWQMSIELIDRSQGGSLSMQEFAPYLRRYIGNAYSQFPDIQIADPVLTADLNAAQVSWTFTMKTPGDTTILMRAITEVRKQGNVLSVFTFYLPDDQFDAQEAAIMALRDSLVVNQAALGQ